MAKQNCQFGAPLYYDTVQKMFEPINNGDSLDGSEKSWNFSSSSCEITGTSTMPAYMEKISTTSGDIYLDKSVSAGDIFLIAFFAIFFLAGTMTWILRFIFKEGVSFKR